MSLLELFYPWWQLGLALISLGVVATSLAKSRTGSFYGDTFPLTPLGIFVWGDGLILGPFWLLSSGLFLILSPLNTLRYFLLFYLMRSGYEVVYWINHQVAQKDYRPPLFRSFTWLASQEAAILYQLLNMCQCLLATMGLILTFTLR